MAKVDIKGSIGLDSSKFERGIQRSKKSLKNFARGATASFIRMGAAFAGIGLVKSIIGLGTAAAETASKFDAVFKGAADRMNEAVLELKKTIPATTAEMQNALATFASMGKAFGFNTDAANEFSINMVKIAGDLASFHDMKPEEAFLKIRSAISGEFEPLKQLGIVLNEATLKQEALNLKIWDGTGQMSAAQKAMTVQSLILKQMGDAQGDAAATADSAANKIKFFRAMLIDLGTEIGTNLLPAITKMVSALSSVVGAAKSASEAVGAFAATKIYGKGEEEYEAFLDRAKKELEEMGKLTGKRGDKKKIEERAKALNDEFNERQRIKKEAKEQKAIEEGITDEVSDPDRVKAGEEYAASLEEQIKLAGKLDSIESGKSGAKNEEKELKDKILQIELAILRAQTRGETAAVESLQKRLEMAKRIMEIMAKGASQEEATAIANEEQKKGGAKGGKSSGAQWGTIGTKREFQSSYGSRFGAAPTMEERERASGLYLAGNDPMSGRKAPGGMPAGDKAAKTEDSEAATLKEMAGSLKVIESTMTE